MRGIWFRRFFGVALFILIVAAGFGQAVLQLWNWLMPGLFGLHTITYWQALGLLCLSWILFGGLRGWPRGGGYWRHRMRERWERMTPEEREKFRAGMQRRCGHHGTPAAPATKA
jgi:hypothetical protein